MSFNLDINIVYGYKIQKETVEQHLEEFRKYHSFYNKELTNIDIQYYEGDGDFDYLGVKLFEVDVNNEDIYKGIDECIEHTRFKMDDQLNTNKLLRIAGIKQYPKIWVYTKIS